PAARPGVDHRRAQDLRLHHPVRAALHRRHRQDHDPGDPPGEAVARLPRGRGVSDDAGGYQIELPEFEGPLDLLLHLVKKHELNILDIPIAFITDQYLKMLDLMRQLNLDVAGEYLLMAATLAHLKSRELVPPDPLEQVEEAGDDEDELDPRQELIRR